MSQSQASQLSSRAINNFKCQFCKKPLKTAQGLKSHITRLHKNVDEEGTDNSTPQCTESSSTEDTLISLLANLKLSLKVLRRIPKGARSTAAEALAKTIDVCLQENSEKSWERLLLFTASCLQVPVKSEERQVSLSTLIKRNISDFLEGKSIGKRNLKPKLSESPKTEDRLVKLVEAKISDGDVSGAVRVLCSEDSFAPHNEETLAALIKKHPAENMQSVPIPVVEEPAPRSLRVVESEVVGVIASFPAGSAGGLDLLRPQHLKDLTSHSAGPAGKRLVASLTKLCNLMLSGQVPEAICPVIYGASLCALKKKDGGIRPIAVGCTLRRMVAKLGCNYIKTTFGDMFQPIQMGFGTKGGIEVASHAARRYVNFNHESPKVFLKIDFLNAFNMIRRDHMLRSVSEKMPELFHFLSQCYCSPSYLAFGENLIPSLRGIQQGDPLGPALFCMEVHPIASSMRSELNIWYLDDATLAGPPDIVLQDFITVKEMSEDIGLEVNTAKCELFVLNKFNNNDQNMLKDFKDEAPNVKILPTSELILLGSPLTKEALKEGLESKVRALNRVSNRIASLSSHCGFYILKNSQAIPKLTHILRCSPTWSCPDGLASFDNALKEAIEAVTNISLSNAAWKQSAWPVSEGGLGIRCSRDLAIPAFLASVCGTSNMVKRILPRDVNETRDLFREEGLELWISEFGPVQPLEERKHIQREWERPGVQKSIVKLHEQATTPKDKARLIGVSAAESGAFLQALPSAPLGTLLNSEAFRVAVALRLGSNICQPHLCLCGSEVDESGTHGLSCKKSAGRASRHATVNDIIKRALASAGVPSVLEPSNLDRDNNRRPDGITQIPWAEGKSLVWDFTCTDGLAPSYLASSSVEPLYAATTAERNKRTKYADLGRTYTFTPVAVECLGAFGRESLRFIHSVGKKITEATGEKHATQYLIQRISVAIQRGNAAAVLGSIPPGATLDDFISLF